MTLDQLASDIRAGFLDKVTPSNRHYLPRLLTNRKGVKFLDTVQRELNTCDSFFFSVAFLTKSGMSTLIETFKELEERGIPGKIIVSQYQNFTEPQALRQLLHFTNIHLRIVTEGNMHTKGFIFKHQEHYTLIVGSSNLTQNALCSNREWNLAISSAYAGSIVTETCNEFKKLWNEETTVQVTEEWIQEYEKIYQQPSFKNIQTSSIKPNKMQNAALENLKALRENNETKALLISATGTGKTYLSAFDAKEVNPKRLLFLVHREKIAKDAKKTFEKVFGNTKKMGLYTGGKKDSDADYIFSTIQTFSKDKNLYKYKKDAFDYIIIDEAHHTGAISYNKITEWFTPKFLLGMTATPERTDKKDILKYFDHNIAYEIRLNDALEEHLLCPFHYYGVTDIAVNGEIIDDNTYEHAFNHLVCEERVRNILEKAKFYGCDHGRVKGLIFCSRIEEAKELSKKLDEHGLKTLALDGDGSTESQREKAIKRLEAEGGDKALDYLITVDIFNEGIDIPSLNQIIMLRPTKSAIIFVQQLGRGLRKAPNKEYLTVIDFIGNYNNNYLLPIALFGDTSYNKDTIRKLITTGSSLIPGASTVDFDLISRKRIFDSLDRANVDAYKELKNDYDFLKFKIGRKPKMMDFIEHGSRDPYAYVRREGSLYSFIAKMDSDTPRISAEFEKRLKFFSSEICNGKRLEESIILQTMTEKEETSFGELLTNLQNNYSVKSTNASLMSAIHLINGKFNLNKDVNKFAMTAFLSVNGDRIEKTETFKTMLKDTTFKEYLEDALQYSKYTFLKNYTAEAYKDGFTLYSKYSRKDVCRILNWKQNEESVMYGYSIKYNTCPIFVTYRKSDNISESIKYEDKFIDPSYFHWMTRNGVKLDSKEVQMIQDYQNSGLRILLFVKKSDAESSDFYYMGDMKPDQYTQETIRDNNGKEKPIVNINFKMDVPASDDIYRYLTEV